MLELIQFGLVQAIRFDELLSRLLDNCVSYWFIILAYGFLPTWLIVQIIVNRIVIWYPNEWYTNEWYRTLINDSLDCNEFLAILFED